MLGEDEVQYTISPSEDSTIAIEISKTGLLRKYKHLLFFQNFGGEFRYSSAQPEVSRLNMTIDANSIVCRDRWLKARKQRRITEYARSLANAAGKHPEIRFSSNRMA